METIMQLIADNPEVFVALLLAGSETIAGIIPDRYLPYVGGLRWLLGKIMKNKGGGIKLLIIPLLFFAGCATAPPSDVCQTEQPSLICEEIPQPGNADILLQLANVRMLKNDSYTAQQALDFLDKCEDFIDGTATYKNLAQWVASETGKLDIEVIILSKYINTLNVDLPISEYDRMLLKAHIQRQKDVVSMYIER